MNRREKLISKPIHSAEELYSPILYAMLNIPEDRATSGLDKLLATGFKINGRDHHGAAAIHYAAYYNMTGVLRALIKRGGNPAAINTENKMNALHFALAHGNVSCARYLRKLGVEVLPRGNGAIEALICAASHGYVGAVKFLLDAGVNPKRPAKNGETALGILRHEPEDSQDHQSVKRLLISAGAKNERPRDSDQGCMRSLRFPR